MPLWVQIVIIIAILIVIAVTLHFAFEVGKQMLISVIVISAVGILAHFVGEALPRRLFDPEKFPYRAYPWEKNGRIYEKLGVRKWKDYMPDKSRWVKSSFEKTLCNQSDPESLRHLLQETCVAECIHWILFFLSPLILVFTRGTAAYIITALYALSNFPLIVIQRYNRPRLRRLLQRRLRAAQKEADAR